uniref:Uncharacterized protein n=1 Tax=Cucumis melo TaxID=3656 RepID=A0A9I9E6A7_CUCME
MEANEESIKNKEKVKSLLLLLQVAYEERDEARDKLQKLMNKIMPTSINFIDHHDNHSQLQFFFLTAEKYDKKQ